LAILKKGGELMKKFLVISLFLFCLIPSAYAEIGIGYETLLIYPHAFTFNYVNTTYDLGISATADFGHSAVSNIASEFLGIFGEKGKYSFYTLAINKYFYKKDKFRGYIGLGTFIVNHLSTDTSSTSNTHPLIQLGGEWKEIFGKVAFATEIGYPELITIGLRYYL
jgi:hypothetical protein